MSKNIKHIYWTFPSNNHDLWEIDFNAEIEGEDLFSFLGMSDSNWVVNVSDPKYVETLFKRMRFGKFYDNSASERITKSSSLMELIAVYVEARYKAENAANEFDSIVSYMKEHLYNDISLEQLAGLLYLSPKHFSDKFTRKMGTPPIRYFAQLKAKEAIRLLCTTELTPAEIGKSLGIPNPYYFNKFFEKHTGISPSDCKKMFVSNNAIECKI